MNPSVTANKLTSFNKCHFMSNLNTSQTCVLLCTLGWEHQSEFRIEKLKVISAWVTVHCQAPSGVAVVEWAAVCLQSRTKENITKKKKKNYVKTNESWRSAWVLHSRSRYNAWEFEEIRKTKSCVWQLPVVLNAWLWPPGRFSTDYKTTSTTCDSLMHI